MPFEIVRNDITNMQVDAIVNTANPRPVVGSGTDAAIHMKAGPQLLQARQKIGNINRGCSAITPAFQLPAKYVIHTVGPVWLNGSQAKEQLLRSCYDSALQLALAQGCQSIAFPLISTGNYGFPKDKALQIAIAAFSEFLLKHEIHIYLVVYDRDSFQLSEKLFQAVSSYIDDHYVHAHSAARQPSQTGFRFPRRQDMETCESCVLPEDHVASGRTLCAPMAAPKATSLEDMLKQADAGFTETLLKLIDQSGKKDSEIYKKANLSKQHFSKIRNNPNYKPTKPTAIALALALELNLEDTKDLIGRAGYALTNSSKFDLIVRFFIEQGKYNIMEINLTLYEFDQSLLGA